MSPTFRLHGSRTNDFVSAHDRSVLTCLAALLRLESAGEFLDNGLVCRRATSAFGMGDSGCAVRPDTLRRPTSHPGLTASRPFPLVTPQLC